jgi:hypothetical protein
MERSKTTGNQQDQMEEFLGCPMLHKEQQELNQVQLVEKMTLQ